MILEQILPTCDIAEDFTNFLRSIRHLHVMSVSKDLGDYKTVITNFEEHFFNLFHKYQLAMTLKVHIVLHHYQYYFETTGETFKETNGEFTETAHSTLRREEEQHGMKIVRRIGTPIHQYRNLK